MDELVATMADMAQEGRTTVTEPKKNFKTGYSEYSTLAEAEQFAKRETARSFSSTSIWQRVSETVVPTIDVTIKAVDVTTTAVTA